MPGFGSFGFWEVLLILIVLLLVFGAKRLPEIGSALGRGIREFKGSVRDIEGEISRSVNEPPSRDIKSRQSGPAVSGPQPEPPAGSQPAQSESERTPQPKQGEPAASESKQDGSL